MIKGILALFTSGLFFHPMVLSGIILGIVVSSKFETEQIYAFLQLSYFYIGAVILAFIYTIIFAKVYKEGGAEVDMTATALRGIGNSVKLILAFLLTLMFTISWIF